MSFVFGSTIPAQDINLSRAGSRELVRLVPVEATYGVQVTILDKWNNETVSGARLTWPGGRRPLLLTGDEGTANVTAVGRPHVDGDSIDVSATVHKEGYHDEEV